MKAAGIITLITDFGLNDPYVGQLKGAALTRNPQVRLIDLCHSISPQDIPNAAVNLHSSYVHFPAGSVHLVVVDPGVGSQRRLLAAASADHFFIAPDNGIFSLLLRDAVLHQVHVIENQQLFNRRISTTFHGRDIMAPVAAALAGGMNLSEVGPDCSLESCVRLSLPVAVISRSVVRGEVLQVDHFGNIRTSIIARDLAGFPDRNRWTVSCGEALISDISRTYAEVPVGSLTAVFDSNGYLEIVVNQGSAALLIQAKNGDPVTARINQNDLCGHNEA
jgi:S-adenosylmethionine hydrolase